MEHEVSAAEGRRTIVDLVVEDCVFEGVREFDYLRVILNICSRISDDMHQRITSGRAY